MNTVDEHCHLHGTQRVLCSSATRAKQMRLFSKLFRLASTRTPNVFGETIRRLAPVAPAGNTSIFGTPSNAGQKEICAVVVIASAGNSAQNVPSKRSNPSAVLVRVICCRTVSDVGNLDVGNSNVGNGARGDFSAVNRRDTHSRATSNTRKMAINPTLASGGRHAAPTIAKKQANQKGRRIEGDRRRETGDRRNGQTKPPFSDF